jgi:hypothetical protein
LKEVARMTEAECLNAVDPAPMLTRVKAKKASERKLRLFACACCRRIWHLLTDERSRNAVEVAERFADGEASAEELKAAQALAQAVTGDRPWYVSRASAAHAAAFASAPPTARRPRHWDRWAAGNAAVAARPTPPPAGSIGDKRDRAEMAEQARLVREVFGHIFHKVTAAPAWLAWNGGAVGHLAQSIYAERAFEQMPILADALEDAGCDNAALLRHCRETGPHVRGCWALDLLTARD